VLRGVIAMSDASDNRPPPVWQRWMPRAGVIAAGFTALCCLGVAAALSMATSVGATFPTRDTSLRPLLAATLLFTALGRTLTFTRHRKPGPLIVTIAAGLWMCVLTFAVGASSRGAARHDAMGAHEDGASHQGLGGRSALVWFGLVVLIAAQVWDVFRMRVGRGSAAAAA